jgi:hypothetical protein
VSNSCNVSSSREIGNSATCLGLTLPSCRAVWIGRDGEAKHAGYFYDFIVKRSDADRIWRISVDIEHLIGPKSAVEIAL